MSSSNCFWLRTRKHRPWGCHEMLVPQLIDDSLPVQMWILVLQLQGTPLLPSSPKLQHQHSPFMPLRQCFRSNIFLFFLLRKCFNWESIFLLLLYWSCETIRFSFFVIARAETHSSPLPASLPLLELRDHPFSFFAEARATKRLPCICCIASILHPPMLQHRFKSDPPHVIVEI